jgi:hypothetical protein
MTTTSTPSLIKNEDGSYSYGSFVVLAPVYDRSIKKHIFNIIRNGCVPIRHEGNFLTLKNSIKKLTEGVVPSERTEVYSLGEMLGIKPDASITSEQLLEAVTPVYYAPNILSNEDLGIEFPEIEEVQDYPLMAALKASIEASNRDLRSDEAEEKYQAFYALLVEDIEATTKALEERGVALAE